MLGEAYEHDLIQNGGDVLKELHTSYLYNLYREKQLTALLEEAKSREAGTIIEEILSQCDAHSEEDSDIVKVVAYDIVGTMLKVCEKLSFNADAIVQSLPLLEKSLESRDKAKLKECLLSIADNVCKCSEGSSMASSVIEAAAQYVNKNYGNAMMSIPTIAKQFNIHPNYLSSIFKADRNMTVMEYVAVVRIGAAKKLLGETSLPIRTISQRVGYTNPHTFTRIFKKYEGITPSEFRKM